MKQTAVEWLEEQTRTSEWHSLKRQDIIEQAKELEKQQIIDAYADGKVSVVMQKNISYEQYYNEIFNK